MGIFKDEYHTTNNYQSPAYPQSVTVKQTSTVTEVKAPTDASVGLLNEMQEKAMANIIGRLQVNDTYLRAQAFHYRDNMSFCNIIGVKYTYNTHERIVKHEYDSSEKNLQKIVNGLIEAISKDIAQVIVNSCINNIASKLMGNKYGA